jgi:hypothetical protein
VNTWGPPDAGVIPDRFLRIFNPGARHEHAFGPEEHWIVSMRVRPCACGCTELASKPRLIEQNEVDIDAPPRAEEAQP